MEMKIEGIEETLQLLQTAPKNIVMLGYARAARAGINVIARELVKRTPIAVAENKKLGRKGKAWHDRSRGALVRSLRIKVAVDSSARGVVADVGFPGEQATVADALEFGHMQTTHYPEHKDVRPIPAKPFMRPAFDASAEEAIEAFATSLEATLKEAY